MAVTVEIQVVNLYQANLCSSPHVRYSRMALLYHRFMTPNWLDKNAEFNCKREVVDDVRLTIGTDGRKYENIFKLSLIPAGFLKRKEDITVRMLVGIELPEPKPQPQPPDPLAFMLSDGSKAIGIQLRDPTRDYGTKGPYIGIEGNPGRGLDSVTEMAQGVVTTTSRLNPDQFEIVIKPTQFWGSAYCAIDTGHKLCVTYFKELDLSKEIKLDLYRDEPNEVYSINYIELWIYRDGLANKPCTE